MGEPAGAMNAIPRAIATSLLSATFLVASAVAQQQTPQPEFPAPTVSPILVRALTISGEHARANGVIRCLATIDRYAGALTQAAPHDAQSTWHSQIPDDRLFNSVIAFEATPAVGLVTAAPAAAACDIGVQYIAYHSESCISLRERSMRGWQLTWQTGSVIAFSDGGARTAYLLQAGAGCVSIEQQVHFIDGAPAADP